MAKYCVFFIALPLPVIIRTICLFDNFEKLSYDSVIRGPFSHDGYHLPWRERANTAITV